MAGSEEFRFKAHELLIELDASTNHLMLLVVSHQLTGASWTTATERYASAYAAWDNHLKQQTLPASHLL